MRLHTLRRLTTVLAATLLLAAPAGAQAPKPPPPPKPAAKPAAPADKKAPAKPAAKPATPAPKPAPKAEKPEPVSVAPAGEKLDGPLNTWLKNVSPRNRSALTLWPAWVKASDMPAGAVPMPADIWSGMPDREAWAQWASSNADLAKALRASGECIVLGMAYGDAGGDPAWKPKGLEANPGSAEGDGAFPYLRAVRGLAAFSMLRMQQLGTEGKYDEAFVVGLDGLRMLRQVAEQRMLSEKAVALELLASGLEAHRVFMADHQDRVPLAVLQDAALRGYPFLKAGDRDRLSRLELPEGDRMVIEERIGAVFTSEGQPDASKFGQAMGAVQARNEPVTRFGAVTGWTAVAEQHGSLEATRARLGDVYDDWWRRWRMRFYDSIVERPSEFSRLNPVRYALITLLVGDLQRVFDLRMRVIAELNATSLVAGLCGFRVDNGKQWPRDLGQIFPTYALKKMDMDPYSRKYGSFQYRDVGSKAVAIDSPWGTVEATGACVWSLGGDHDDGSMAKHDPPDGIGDLVFWPPPRQLAQKAGLIK
jgi:hypothetical protein